MKDTIEALLGLAFWYLMIAVLYGVGAQLFGNYGYAGYTYNIKRGFSFPTAMLESSTNVDASSDWKFNDSISEMMLEHKNPHGVHLFEKSLLDITLLIYAKHNLAFNKEQYLTVSNKDYRSIIKSLNTTDEEKSRLAEEVRTFLNEMSFKDVLEAGSESEQKLQELLKIRS